MARKQPNSDTINDSIQRAMHNFIYHEIPKGRIKDPDGTILKEYKAKVLPWFGDMKGQANAVRISANINQMTDVNKLIETIANIEMKNAGLGVIK